MLLRNWSKMLFIIDFFKSAHFLKSAKMSIPQVTFQTNPDNFCSLFPDSTTADYYYKFTCSRVTKGEINRAVALDTDLGVVGTKTAANATASQAAASVLCATTAQDTNCPVMYLLTRTFL